MMSFSVECVVPLPVVTPTCEAGACVVRDGGEACRYDDGFCRGR